MKIYGASKLSTVYVVKSSNLGLGWELSFSVFPPKRLDLFGLGHTKSLLNICRKSMKQLQSTNKELVEKSNALYLYVRALSTTEKVCYIHFIMLLCQDNILRIFPKYVHQNSNLFVPFVYSRTATGMDQTLPHCSFENLKPVKISKNCFNII